MTNQGTAHGQFQCAIQRRNLFAAEEAASEIDYVSLPHALALTVLIGEESPERYERAAVRWHARFVQSGERDGPGGCAARAGGTGRTHRPGG
jgi:hypothetical protein